MISLAGHHPRARNIITIFPAIFISIQHVRKLVFFSTDSTITRSTSVENSSISSHPLPSSSFPSSSTLPISLHQEHPLFHVHPDKVTLIPVPDFIHLVTVTLLPFLCSRYHHHPAEGLCLHYWHIFSSGKSTLKIPPLTHTND